MEGINQLSMDLNRLLIPVHYCKNGDLFQVDLAVPIPAFPEFDELEHLAPWIKALMSLSFWKGNC